MKTLYIIDGYSLMYTSVFAGGYTGLSSPSEEPTYGTFIFTKTLLKLLRDHSPDMLCVAVDGPAKTFRRELYEDYKANRKERTEEEKIEFFTQVNRMKQILELMDFPTYYSPGYEADDVIGTIIEKASPELSITICSKDKDLFQLLANARNIYVFDPYKNRKIGSKEFFEKYGIKPFQFIDYLALVGDSTDNIPGVKGIGPKTACKLLNQIGDVDTIYYTIDDVEYDFDERCNLEKNIGRSTLKQLREGRSSFYLSRDLATIRKDIDIEIDFEDMKRKEIDWDKLNPIFEELDFTSLMKLKFGNRELP